MRGLRYTLLLMMSLWLSIACVCQAEETIHLQLRWHHQFQFAGYYAALQQGYYQKAGLNVIIHEGSPKHTPVNQVLKNEAQYGVANSELLLARLQGQPLVLLAAVFQHSPSVLVARKDANIFNPSDLIGKKVMMIGDYVDADFVAMFNNEHINIKNINIIPSSYDIQDLVTGKVDAFNSYTSNEPYFLEQQKIPYTILYPRNYGVDFYSDMLFTSQQELDNHPKRVKAFLDASLKGWRYALAHPEEIIALLKKQYKVPKTKDHLEFEAKAIQALIVPDLVEIGHINPWRLQHMAETLLEAGMVENIDTLKDFIYQPDATRERLKHYLKIAIAIATVISSLATIFYLSYRTLKRENRHRQRIEQQLRKQTEELALHNNILQQINQGIALPELLTQLTKQVEQLHPKMICSILLLDEEAKLRHGAAPSLPDIYNRQVDGLAIGEGVGSCGTAAYRGERCIVEDIHEHPFWAPYLDLAKLAGVRACWSQPIKDNNGKVLGTFAMYHTKPNKPTDSEINLIESYAALAQLAIEHSRADVALAASEQRLRFVLKGSGLGFWDWKIDEQKIEINSNGSEVSCYHYADISPNVPEWLNFIYPDEREKTWQSIHKLLKGEQDIHQVEYRIIDKTGQTRWILDRANIVQYDSRGKPIRMSGTHTDITERKLAEQQLRDSEQRLYLCQLYGGIGTWEADLIHNQQIWSPAVFELLNFPFSENPRWEDFLEIVHPDDRQAIADATENHIKTGSKYDVTYRIFDNNQQIRWMRSVGRIDTDDQPNYFRGIVQDVTELKMAEAQIKQLAFYDPLTQLPNRRLLSERLHCAINVRRCEAKRLAILMLDLDRFKAVNDNLGHAAGDELLQQVATRISTQLQETDTVARLGGDEFVVLLPNTTQKDVERTSLAIIHELSLPFILRGTKVNIGTSIGISFYPEHGDTPDILLDYADSALYQAKDQGRGCFCIAPESNAA